LGRQRCVIETDPRQRTRPEVLDEHVGLCDQPIEHRAALGVFEVEGDAFFVAIDAQEICALAFEKRRSPRTRVVAFARLFNFDDARAHVREQHRAVRSRQHARQVENGDPVEWRHNEAMIIVYAGSA
jgi:hypothetical protein